MYEQDRELARRLIAGDERAFDEFFEDHFPGLFRFALARLGGDEDAAEDIAQAVLCQAISKIRTYRGEAALFTWLCSFCRHGLSAHYRARGREERRVDLVEDNPRVRAALESLGAGLDAPDQALARSEIARIVQIVLDQLPVRYGNVLEWKYLEELPVKEIAERLAVSPKAAESLLTRAREAFRDGFQELARGESSS
jgi:RNA polymerase sigma-70 factor (ECF subfamily)